MNKREELSIDEKEWRRLCSLISNEADTRRLSELVDQLLKELDARRHALRKNEKTTHPVSGDI